MSQLMSLMVLRPRSTKLGAGAVSPYTIAAGVFLAVCQALNQLLVSPSGWRDVITVVIAAAAAYGVQPLFGPALTTVLHIPAQVLFFVAAALSVANGAVSAIAMSTTLHTVIAGVITLLAAVLFGSPIPTPVANARRAATAP